MTDRIPDCQRGQHVWALDPARPVWVCQGCGHESAAHAPQVGEYFYCTASELERLGVQVERPVYLGRVTSIDA